MTARAVVAHVAGDGAVTLDVGDAIRCEGCAGACMWRRLKPTRLHGRFAHGNLEQGMTVQVSLPERTVLYGSVVAYGLPLAALLAGAVVGTLATGSDAGTLLGAVAGAAAIVAFGPLLRRRVEAHVLGEIDVKPLP